MKEQNIETNSESSWEKQIICSVFLCEYEIKTRVKMCLLFVVFYFFIYLLFLSMYVLAFTMIFTYVYIRVRYIARRLCLFMKRSLLHLTKTHKKGQKYSPSLEI